MESTNTFYTSFDYERFPESPLPENEYRSPFQIERDRIIFSYPFRRLQSKTQVFQSGEYDFYRTRLTHTIEVAKIGRSICEYFRSKSQYLDGNFYIDPDLVEAICLAHDLGHPPFGHIGERRLNKLMATHGGFEGNAQTLRILTELIYERSGSTKGVAPTRAFLDGVLKYKATQSECTNKQSDGTMEYPKNHFIYNEQAGYLELVFGGYTPPDSLRANRGLNKFKSIECQIMDWADDTAYSLNDIVDGIHARYISVSSVSEWAAAQKLNLEENALIEKLCRKIRECSYEPYFGSLVGRFVHGCHLEKRPDGFLSGQTQRHAFDLVVDTNVKTESKLYKRLATDLIFRSVQLQQIEYKGSHILDRLFNALAEHADSQSAAELHILPVNVRELIAGEKTVSGKYRRICDYTAGLTDGLAMRTYKRLFDPDFGSISELA